MRPVIFANKVSSLPRPTLRPGFTRVPRWRTIIVPPGTNCPPNALKPSRWAFESRPFRDVPCPFLCAIWSSQFSVKANYLLLLSRLLRDGLLGRLLLCRLRRRFHVHIFD